MAENRYETEYKYEEHIATKSCAVMLGFGTVAILCCMVSMDMLGMWIGILAIMSFFVAIVKGYLSDIKQGVGITGIGQHLAIKNGIKPYKGRILAKKMLKSLKNEGKVKKEGAKWQLK